MYWIMLQPLLTYVCWLMPPSIAARQQLAHTTTSICSPYPHLVKSKDIQEIYHRSPEGTSYSVDCVYNAWSDWFLRARSIVTCFLAVSDGSLSKWFFSAQMSNFQIAGVAVQLLWRCWCPFKHTTGVPISTRMNCDQNKSATGNTAELICEAK